ncbi:hypothetical protein VNI00_013274 [Paramarasmius palmivorus]|uniref:Uncharacterized protein n=1 Tax=Paramarasmius palmivorus TaxID=297713 RepID=A0AAW0C0C2_9AGAR
MSVYTPFKRLLGVRVKESESFYTASESKGARPGVVVALPRGDNIYTIAIMASFNKSEQDKVPDAFKDFLIPVPTTRWHVDPGVDHVHTTPEWESAPQYLILIPVKCHKDRLLGRWKSYRVDNKSQQHFEFYVHEAACKTLEDIIQKRLIHWDTVGRHQLTREEFLKRLEKVKEDRVKTLKESTNSALSHTPSCKSACKRTIRSKMTSLAEVPEEITDSEGFKLVCSKRVKRHRENHPTTPSTKSRR